MKKFIISSLLLLPVSASAQGLTGYFRSGLEFITQTLIPFILGIAFLFVVFNVVRYFVIESTNEDGRKKAKAYILYSVAGFVVIIVFFGIVELLVQATGFTAADREVVVPDYCKNFGGDCGGNGGGNSLHSGGNNNTF